MTTNQPRHCQTQGRCGGSRILCMFGLFSQCMVFELQRIEVQGMYALDYFSLQGAKKWLEERHEARGWLQWTWQNSGTTDMPYGLYVHSAQCLSLKGRYLEIVVYRMQWCGSCNYFILTGGGVCRQPGYPWNGILRYGVLLSGVMLSYSFEHLQNSFLMMWWLSKMFDCQKLNFLWQVARSGWCQMARGGTK